MNDPRGPNDFPPTDAELERIYGTPVTEYERMDAIRRQSEAFDKDDLMDVLYEHGERLLADIANGFAWSVGDRIIEARKETIARRASMELYGKPDVIKASEIQS